jgi:hypothetical protein
MNAIGLSGAHRTGKTTLARIFAQRYGFALRQTDTAAVFQQHGFDPAQPLDFNTRLWLQEQVLAAAQTLWAAPGDFICDRTPLDFMAYTLGDIQGNTEVDYERLCAYLNRCFEALNSAFKHLIIVQPGIPLVHEAGKAALNKAYIEHLNSLVLGLAHDPRQSCAFAIMPRDLLNLDQRGAWLAHYIKNTA